MESCLRAALVSVGTRDVPRLQAFYSALLGLSPVVFLGDRYVEFRPPGLRLGLYFTSQDDWQPHWGSTSICLQVEDLEELLAIPILQGASISPLRTASHGREVDCRDPDGNRIVLHEPTPDFWAAMAWE